MLDLLDYCHHYRHIFCYGAGKYGRALRIFLYCHGIDIAGFVTTTKSKFSKILKKKVNTLDEIKYSSDTAILLGVSPRYHEEMINELKMRDIDNYYLLDMSQLILIFEKIKVTNEWVALADNNVCVLLYHRVNPYNDDYWNLSITPEMFANHMENLKENYHVVRFGDDWHDVDSFSVAVTFDDGYADNFKYALPILEKYEMPASIFVSTRNIGTNREFWWDKLAGLFFNNRQLPNVITFDGISYEAASFTQRLELIKKIHPQIKALSPEKREVFFQQMINELGLEYMPNEENRSMSVEELQITGQSPYIDIGAHTITHTALAMEDEYCQQKEIQGSKEYLEKQLGKKIDIFSYPFGADGDFTNKTAEIVKQCGFTKAATTTKCAAGILNNPMFIPRFRVPFCCDSEHLLQELKSIFLMFA